MRRFTLPVLACLAFLAAHAQTAPRQKDTVTYLQKLQNPDGGFRPTARAGPSSLRATVAAWRALGYFRGGTDREPCAAFVKRCFDKDTGGFADRPRGRPDPVLTAIGLMAVAELKLP